MSAYNHIGNKDDTFIGKRPFSLDGKECCGEKEGFER